MFTHLRKVDIKKYWLKILDIKKYIAIVNHRKGNTILDAVRGITQKATPKNKKNKEDKWKVD